MKPLEINLLSRGMSERKPGRTIHTKRDSYYPFCGKAVARLQWIYPRPFNKPASYWRNQPSQEVRPTLKFPIPRRFCHHPRPAKEILYSSPAKEWSGLYPMASIARAPEGFLPGQEGQKIPETKETPTLKSFFISPLFPSEQVLVFSARRASR